MSILPTIPCSQARERTLKTRVSDDELAEVRRRASLAQRSASDYLRLIALGRLPEPERQRIGGE